MFAQLPGRLPGADRRGEIQGHLRGDTDRKNTSEARREVTTSQHPHRGLECVLIHAITAITNTDTTCKCKSDIV